MDENGWVSLDELIAKSPAKMALSKEALERIVAQSDKQRFALNADGRMIRANQGHSVPVDLNLQPKAPPATLYHGTATRFLDSILEKGLLKGQRHHVHLSDAVETASKVGQRHGTLALLAVAAERMHAAGHRFFLSDNGVSLTDAVPVAFLSVVEPATHGDSPPQKKKRPKAP